MLNFYYIRYHNGLKEVVRQVSATSPEQATLILFGNNKSDSRIINISSLRGSDYTFDNKNGGFKEIT